MELPDHDDSGGQHILGAQRRKTHQVLRGPSMSCEGRSKTKFCGPSCLPAISRKRAPLTKEGLISIRLIGLRASSCETFVTSDQSRSYTLLGRMTALRGEKA
jgi:hypothetical protein